MWPDVLRENARNVVPELRGLGAALLEAADWLGAGELERIGAIRRQDRGINSCDGASNRKSLGGYFALNGLNARGFWVKSNASNISRGAHVGRTDRREAEVLFDRLEDAAELV